MNKPLFETHKALFKRLNGFYIPIDVANAIQSCTVDREEHEAVLKRELYYKEHMEAEQRARIDGVERLKKELEAENVKYNETCDRRDELLDEVERLNKQYGDCYYALAEANVEISRLKKELGEQSLQWAKHCNEAYLKGERRAMERVKEAINRSFMKWANDNSVGFALEDIQKELGLGDEVEK